MKETKEREAMNSTMWEDEGDDWLLLDDLLAAIRKRYYSPDEVVYALATCISKVAAQADWPPEFVARIHRTIDSAIDFQTSMEGYDEESLTPKFDPDDEPF